MSLLDLCATSSHNKPRIQRRDVVEEADEVTLCGWRVRSAIPMPELRSWSGPTRQLDVDIRLGQVPRRIEDTIIRTPLIEVGRNGACRLEIEDVARFLIREGREITIETANERALASARTFLLGVVLALLSHQRALLPLHAACVRIDHRTVLLAGASGAGKSTLAAALAKRGHEFLADDVCVVDASGSGIPRLLPSAPRAALWRDALDALGISTLGLQRNRDEQERYHVMLSEPGAFDCAAVPISAVCLLASASETESEGVRALSRNDALAALSAQVFCPRLAPWLRTDLDLNQDLFRLVKTVPSGIIMLAPGLDRISAAAECIERKVVSWLA